MQRSFLATLLLCSTAAAQGDGFIWVVDQAGGGDFQQVSDAVSAAKPGDRILAKTGVYGGFVIDGKSLAVEAADGAHVEIRGEVRVQNLNGVEWVVLRDLHTATDLVPSDEVATLVVSGGVGETWVEDCTFGLPAGKTAVLEQTDFHGPAATVQNANAFLIRSTFAGGPGVDGAIGGAGLFAKTSNTWVHECGFVGGPGRSGATPSPGGHGIDQEGGFVWIAGGDLRGGTGADGVSTPSCSSGGDGGDGMRLHGNSPVLSTQYVTSFGGSGGKSTCGAPGNDGRSRQILTVGSITDHPGIAVGASMPSPLVSGTSFTLDITGGPGDLVFLISSIYQNQTAIPGAIGWQLLGDPVTQLDRIQLSPLGTASITHTTPMLGPHVLISHSFYLQPVAVRPGAGGPVLVYGAPTVTGILSTEL